MRVRVNNRITGLRRVASCSRERIIRCAGVSKRAPGVYSERPLADAVRKPSRDEGEGVARVTGSLPAAVSATRHALTTVGLSV